MHGGGGDGFHKKKSKEELYTKMRYIGEGGFSQVEISKKKKATQGERGGFHKKKSKISYTQN